MNITIVVVMSKKKKIKITPSPGDLILFREPPPSFHSFNNDFHAPWPDGKCYGMCIEIEEESDNYFLGERYAYLLLIQGGITFWLFDFEFQKTRPAIMQVL